MEKQRAYRTTHLYARNRSQRQKNPLLFATYALVFPLFEDTLRFRYRHRTCYYAHVNKILFFVTLNVVCAGITRAETNDAWTTRLEVSDRHALAAMNVQPDRGVCRIRLLNPDDHSQLDLTLGDGCTTWKLLPQKFFPKAMEEQISTEPSPPLTNKLCWVTFKRAEDAWIGYVDNQPVIRAPELWGGKLDIQHPSACSPSEKNKDDYVQKLGTFKFEDNFLVPAGSEFPPTWEIMSGIWRLHSVTGSISGSSGGYQLARQPKPEKSPNFYTLEGGGTNAVVLAGEPFYNRYVCRASVQHNTGTNGIVFLASEHGGYFGFTARTDPASDRLILELWKQPAAPSEPRVMLSAVQTELPAGQWLLLEVETFDDRVICRADNIEVIRCRTDLPPGGRFGLFANMPPGETTRFDDVVAWSHEDRVFESPEDVSFATRTQTHGVQSLERQGKVWLYFPPHPAETNAWLYGSSENGPLRQETLFVSATRDFTCGLSVHDSVSDTTGFRFTCVQSPGSRTYLLEELTATNAITVDRYTTAEVSNRVALAMDALRPNELRCYADGRLVCFSRPAQQPDGVLGVFGVNATDLFFTAPAVSSKDATLSERFEKNPLYVNDPFMRHWASPEGQWVTFKDGMTWFKGDITGPVKVRLPVVNGMDLHLCIPEGASNGLCRVSVRDNRISVFTPDSGTNAALVVPATQVPEIAFDKQQVRLFTVGIEGTVVWLGGDEILLAQTHLSAPLRGRRMRITGMTLENLSHTLVKRDNVFDTLFTESLFNWTLNGGRWEVINRFYCEPTWSHMNGESADSLAALWSKYIFSGDFSIEFYAGMRMGWYERAGDLNLTVMSHSNSTGDGYTAIATGWDPDSSQLYSRLLRNGELMDISTKYLVPRIRAGNARQGYQPLVAAGRDIHGAWYGMQLRRIGTHLKYIYDNEPVFDVEDPHPLQDGSLGIWTYRNSMMVARIKIAAESIRPRPFFFKPIPVDAPPVAEPPEVPDSGIRINGRVAQPLTPAFWQPYDTVSHPSVRFRNLDGAHPEMRVTSILGGGSFLVRCELPPALPDKLLGWRFEIARHPQALVNFEFSTVKDDGKGGTVPLQPWTYVLSGSDESRGPRLIAGKIEAVPPSDPAGTNLVWTPVEIWVPSEVIRSKQAVQIEGFGNLQPSDVQQGLKGNPPHAWYAIRNFREIHRGVPTLSGPPEKRDGIAALTQVVNSLRPGELQMVEIPSALDSRKPVIEWAVPELADFGLHAQEDSTIPGSIIVSPIHPWPSPLLPPNRALADTHPAPFTVEGNNIRVLVPHEILQPGRMTLALELSDGRFFRQVVPMNTDEAANHPPVLLGLEMPEGGIQTFEARPGNAAVHQTVAKASIDYTDPVRGGVLKFANGGAYGRRLDGILVKGFNPAATPLLQFRYKGDPMAIVSLAFGPYAFTFSEVFKTHVRFGEGKTAPMDNTWRVWTGIPFDSAGELPLTQRTAIPPGDIRIASRMDRDQTGLHSTLCIDDIACGPAVGPNRPFAFKADYADPDGVAEVAYAILQGPTAFDNRTEAEKQKVTWLPAKNGEVMQPDIAALPDGIHHLIVRARDKRNLWSQPSDLPFMVDRKPPTVHYAVNAVDKFNGSSLALTLTDPVSPPVVNALHFTCLGTPLAIGTDNGSSAIGQGTVSYELDWIWLLRNQLATAKNGDVMPITVDGITDAAGNAAPPLKIDLHIDQAADKRPPTILPPDKTANVLWMEPSLTALQPFFGETHNVEAKSVDTPQGHVLEVTPIGEGGSFIQHAFTAAAWDPDKFPFLTVSFRSLEPIRGNRPFNVAFNTGPRRPRGIKDAHTLSLSTTNHLAYVTGNLDPEPGEWNDLIINVRDFLRDETEEHKDTPDLTYVSFYFPKSKNTKIQFRSLAILAPWNSDDLIPVKAYDLSGIKGLIWSGGETVCTAFRPANLSLPTKDPNWFRFRVSDRRGNLTDTWMIPIPPGSQKTKTNLPAMENTPF